MAWATSGCYLLQSAQGQLALMARRKPISQVIENPATSQALRVQLKQVTAIRDFATRELGLPDNGSYRSYADVRRRYVVWNVVAAPEFSVEPKHWCFPVVGCVDYRGYFRERRARDFAADLRRRHFDVTVGGVAAYSTLGHFDDPILNTMIGWDDIELASIVFHELTHQLLYVSGDAPFNEALATTVEEEGVRRWLIAQHRDADLTAHLLEQARYVEVIGLLRQTRDSLATIYASGAGEAVMREQKGAAFAELRSKYAAFKTRQPGHGAFDAWFAGDINNAHLASVATYYDCVPGFQRELAAVGGDLPAFYRRVKELGKLGKEERDAVVCAPRADVARSIKAE
jgi:predicted aminopeptidase